MHIMAINLNDLTVVLPTRNEANNIRNFLKSVPETLKLIIVDASEDSTPDIVSSARPDYTSLIRHSGTVTEARRIGAELAATSWLLFTDADIVFSKDYFRNLADIEGCDLIYGPKLSPDYFKTYYRWFAYGQYLIHLSGVPAVSGSNCIISAEAYEESGGFDPRLTCNEDSELGWRVKERGYKTRFDFNLVVYAKDHRRLERGVIRKTLHSITRCTALYLGVLPPGLRSCDWGYWSGYNKNRELQNGN